MQAGNSTTSRTTADGRILWGGYDAIYYWNNGFGSHLENDPASFARLAEHFFQAFPQLEGIRFTHAWGGAIDTCSRFSPFWGTAHHGKTAYVMGYTGLGVGASRFGARVILDILDGQTDRTNRARNGAHQATSLSTRTFAFPWHQPLALVHGSGRSQPGSRKSLAPCNGVGSGLGLTANLNNATASLREAIAYYCGRMLTSPQQTRTLNFHLFRSLKICSAD